MVLISCLFAAHNVSGLASPLDGDIGEVNEFTKLSSDDNSDDTLQSGSTLNSLEFEYVTIEHGLSQNSVLSILQDSKGFMWFGTWDGLNKYDGYEFTTYISDPDDPFSLSENAILSILESRLGYLWIGTGSGGLNRFDRDSEKFIHYYHDPADPYSLSSDHIVTLYEDQTGWLWIGTSGGGLNLFDPQTERFINYQNDPFDSNSLSSNTVTAIFEDSLGTLWIGTGGGGLNRFIPGIISGEDLRYIPFDGGAPIDVITWESDKFTHYKNETGKENSLSSNDVYTIFEDRSGTLWIGTGDGTLNRFDRQSESFIQYRLDPGDLIEPRQNPIHAIAEDPSGKLWVGMEHEGLFHIDPETGAFTQYSYDPRNPVGLSSNNIRSVYSDRSSVLWVGTNGGGLTKLYPSKKEFIYYSNDPMNLNSLSYNEVSSIFEDQFGVLWIGTYGGGLNLFDREIGQFTHLYNNPDDPGSLSGNIVVSIYEDHSGDLWVGTVGGGLNRFDRETTSFTHFLHDPLDPSSLSDNNVGQIFEDLTGAFWVGTLGGGLNKFDRENGTFTHYQHDSADPTSLSSNTVRTIYEDRAGTLWIGTNNGLNEYQGEMDHFTHYFHDSTDPHSLGENYILSMLEDRSGMLWIGTNGGGLDRFDREKKIFTHYRMKDGLLDQVVFGMLEDAQGNIWLSTSKGLSCFSPESTTFKNYDTSDGLPGSGFNANAYHGGRGGEMFFGGLDGLVAFYPDDIQSDPNVPPVVLTQLTQGGETVEMGKAIEGLEEVTFRWPNNFFEFEFAALSYIQPQKNQYAYILEGYDETWNSIGTGRSGRYKNIPEGVYTLRIKGSNHDGIWNEDGVSLKVTVVPPFWATGWFKAALGVMLVVGVIGGYRYRVSRAHARNHELESLVHQRTYEVERRRRVAEGLGEILGLLNSNKSLEEGLDLIVWRVSQLTGASRAVVFRRAEDAPAELLAIYPDNFIYETWAVEQIDTLVEWLSPLIRGGKPLIVPHLGSYPLAGINGIRLNIVESGALLCVPIYVNEEIFGGLGLIYAHERTFSKDDLELVMIFADQAALAIGNALLRERVQNMAVVTERNRLARDLHDAVTQTLFSASLIAEALPALWENNPMEGRQLLEDLRRLSSGALAEMRTLLLELRPTGLGEADLSDLIKQLAETITGRMGVPVQLDVQGEYEIPKNVQVGLYRIAQEALNNIEKHSAASSVTISLDYLVSGTEGELESVTLQVEDDGCGFNADCVSPDHLGLTIMQERAQALGARITVESTPGVGTLVKVVWKG